jgi:DNA-binding MarR family transcriptional regulator
MSRETLVEELISTFRADSRSTDVFDDLACEWLGINRTDSRCLDVLEERGRISAGELAKATALTTGAITAVIDRLEKLGYVRRVPDSADRRKVLVESTDKVRAAAWEIYGPLGEAAGPTLSRYSEEQLQMVIGMLRDGMAIRDAQADRVREMLRERRQRSKPTAG